MTPLPFALDDLLALLPPHLAAQRWFGADRVEQSELRVAAVSMVRDRYPMLVQLRLEVGTSTVPYQLLVGLRPQHHPLNAVVTKPSGVLGPIDTSWGPANAYDGVLDSTLAMTLLSLAAPDERVARARPVGTEQSNTSVVFDERLILKVFRRLQRGANPEVTVVEALAKVGFPWIAEPMGTWHEDGFDLALVQRFLPGATEGWQVALQSVERTARGAAAPGEFSAEASALGTVTAELHSALAEAFGSSESDPGLWADSIEPQLPKPAGPAGPGDDPAASSGAAVLARLRGASSGGSSIRTHGDYHLGQVLRTPNGWFVLDFEGEPLRSLEERQRPTSALRDVAGMLRSFHYASMAAPRSEPDDPERRAEWEGHARKAFLDAYFDAVDPPLVPDEEGDRAAVLAGFELEKAAYEVAYERAHRPDWAHIPLEAIRRLAAGA